MYYELYIDLLFLINFMMDFLILLLVKRMTQCTTTYVRLLLGSLIGAFMSCLIVIYLSQFKILEFMAFHIIVNTVIIKVGFEIKNAKMFIQCLVSLYIGSFLLGGVFQYFTQYLKVGSLFFAMATCSYIVVRGIWKVLMYFQNHKAKWVEVELFVEENRLQVVALMDTGNGLTDPYAEKPVSILDVMCAEKLLEGIDESRVGIRYIPYHTIGNSGVMKAFRASKISVYSEGERCIESPIIAISEAQVSAQGSYQMILNPDIF